MHALRAATLVLSLAALPALAATPAPKAAGATPAPASAECHHPAAAATAAVAAPADGKAAEKASSKAPGKTGGKGEEGWVLTRGEPLTGAPGVTLAELLRAPEAHQGKTVRVEGQVRKACERKGCWMELAEGETGSGVRVTFKDYGFFVPTDSAGARARVEGVVKVTELTEGVASHYASEGGTVPRGADGKPREVQLVASGVELRR